ncbi:hypothetical protein GU926_04795 [Nibribacter ruber]|uniref:STAS/SEC14 domain-containing protein n=1 Tax=Nibribacter ruber TaxID=2698458 RepID=A0A6P1NWU7_9BACT|nr:hypothetical protein [Nibribacter ruber]QHL86794.1 hypothetical protein GU926_04795 [Nibribacter ruber]
MFPAFQFETVYQDEFVLAQLDSNLSFIYVEWSQHPDSQQFKTTFQKVAEMTVQSECKYWLSDPRAIHYLEFGNQNWLLNDMMPLLRQSKLHRFARLVTKESLELMDIVQVYDKLTVGSEALGIKTRFELFLDKEDALEWLFADV